MMRTRLLTAGLVLLASTLLAGCGSSTDADQGLCPTASRYLYYADYLAGMAQDHGLEGGPLRSFFTANLQSLTNLVDVVPANLTADAQAVRAAMEQLVSAFRSADFLGRNLTEADLNRLQQMEDAIGPVGHRLTTWLKQTCGQTPGFGDRPTDAPTDVPPRD